MISLCVDKAAPKFIAIFPPPRPHFPAPFFPGRLQTGGKGRSGALDFHRRRADQDNDLQLQQTGGTDLTFHNVSFEGRDFSSPPYYGLRALWFPSEDSHWGFGAEFFHMKMYANTGDTVSVTGRRNGVGVNDNERIDDTIESFSLSHGLNYVLGDIVYRWFPGQRGEDFLGHLQPYAGIGLGAAIPHVESNVGGTFHEEYQLHGPGSKRSLA